MMSSEVANAASQAAPSERSDHPADTWVLNPHLELRLEQRGTVEPLHLYRALRRMNRTARADDQKKLEEENRRRKRRKRP
jgi:hypothetical protein